jgi:FkbM family methyltransferase
MPTAKEIIQSSLRVFDIGITRFSTLERLREESGAAHDIRMLLTLPNEHASQLIKLLQKSKSQFRQDLFVLSELNFKTNGFFVEFGAGNGIDLSNTYLLEREFGWTGILAEPATCWHSDLKRNRSARVETRCVWKDSNSSLTFNEAVAAELSTISAFSGVDLHAAARRKGRTYEVSTISLNDLLSKHDAPTQIDYLSIDTEGSEFEILSNFDFSRHSFRVITCEHNFTAARERIFELLSSNGYVRKYQELSEVDDWYVRSG